MAIEEETAGELLHATVSIGVATFPWHGRTPKELTHEADQALYRAKADGRNRVVGHAETAQSPLAAIS
jgi:diguanylate cyclase (GGDEF)-like protein